VAHYRATADSLHRIDENAAAEVAPVLAYLRELERHFHTAVAIALAEEALTLQTP